jgi:ring-1,2-phenylacetyl-CoA epoxidase subunit PaaD
MQAGNKMITALKEEEVFKLLSEIQDPEVPALTISDLGMLRSVKKADDFFEITITPTFTGCPAMRTIEEEISKLLLNAGISNFKIKTVLSPAWTTDWISQEGRKKLKEYGIAPPSSSAEAHLKAITEGRKVKVVCPFCNSENTRLTSAFGSTACKSLHYCNNCNQPFEEFKCH